MAESHFQMLKFKEIYVEIIYHNPKYVIMRRAIMKRLDGVKGYHTRHC